MSTCPKCGANNKPNQEACRLCATPLEIAGEPSNPRMIDSLAATVVAQDRGFQESNQGGGEVPCPTCQTLNERSWAFCQHCGSKLRPEPGQVPNPPERVQQAPETVVVPSLREPFKPPAPPAPPPQAAPPTVVASPPSAERQAPPQQAPQPHASQPQAPPGYDRGQAPMAPQTVVATPPPAPPKQEEPQPQPQGQRSGTGQVESFGGPAVKIPGGVPCPQCGYENAPGSAFCGGCGQPIPVARTIVMSSIPATPKGRLHLIMEGGQQGEVYDLKDDTAIGRTMGDISFPHDGFMSSRHARIIRRDDSFILVDEGSRNGTFIKIKNEVELKPGDMILIGKQLFRFEV